MYTLNQLSVLVGRASDILTSMQARLEKLNNGIAKAKEAGRVNNQRADYITQVCEDLKNEALKYFGPELKELQETAKLTQAQREFWSDKPLVLSKQGFPGDPAISVALKTKFALELPMMTKELLGLTVQCAKDEQNWPLLYSCLLASYASRSTPEGRIDIDLADVEIPEQVAALDAINFCWGAVARGEMVYRDARNAGTTVPLANDAITKMNLARQARVGGL